MVDALKSAIMKFIDGGEKSGKLLITESLEKMRIKQLGTMFDYIINGLLKTLVEYCKDSEQFLKHFLYFSSPQNIK
jgi:hypothetical protein